MELGQEKVYNKYHKYLKADNIYRGIKIRLFYCCNVGWKQKIL